MTPGSMQENCAASSAHRGLVRLPGLALDLRAFGIAYVFSIQASDQPFGLYSIASCVI
jgi:hypothetical protein